jgi:hypothetical protein
VLVQSVHVLDINQVLLLGAGARAVGSSGGGRAGREEDSAGLHGPAHVGWRRELPR